jgi:hypothetical protein
MTAPTSVHESMQRHPETPGEAMPAGRIVATLDIGECAAVLDQYDDKDPTAYRVRLANGTEGWVFYDHGAWERVSSCEE